eukprot:Rhum_TRINITY_DN15245_c10_g1::Rhum_TRINITY_DN15245_c10_g1_i1::g.146905::m.146905
MQRRYSQVSGSSRSPSQSPNEGTPLFAGPGGIPRVGSSCTPSPSDSPRGGAISRTAIATPLMKQPLSAVLSRPGSVSDWLCGSEDTDSGDDEAAPGLPRTRQVRRSMEVVRATQLHKAYVTQRQLQALTAGEHGTPPSLPATPLSQASSASQAPPPPPRRSKCPSRSSRTRRPARRGRRLPRSGRRRRLMRRPPQRRRRRRRRRRQCQETRPMRRSG